MGQTTVAEAEAELGDCYPERAIIEDRRDTTCGHQKVGVRVGDVNDLHGPDGPTSVHEVAASIRPTAFLLADVAVERV